MKKLLSLIIICVFISPMYVKAESSSVEDVHVPVVSAPIGFVKGAYWGTRACSGAFGNEEGPLENLLGFIICGPVGAVSGTAAGIFGGPFSDINSKNESKESSLEEEVVEQD